VGLCWERATRSGGKGNCEETQEERTPPWGKTLLLKNQHYNKKGEGKLKNKLFRMLGEKRGSEKKKGGYFP